VKKQILELCKVEKSLKEIAQYFGYSDVYKFKNNYVNQLLEQGKLQMTIPDKPKSRNQKYISSI
jgi:ATP-dependent DNA helicase RecG